MADSNGAKGNPAHIRMANPTKKATRVRSWVKGQERKAERRKAQQQAEERNKALRAEGKLTPHEEKKEARRLRRLNDPDVQARAAEYRKRRG